MPAVPFDKRKLSDVRSLLRCADYSETRSQCSNQTQEDMTQSWISQQTLEGENTQRILYKPKDVTQPSIHPRQCHQGDPQLRMTRHPHVAPHKSMLADDLKLSSDEEDSQTVNHEPAWDSHSRTAQRVLSHGRRVRHSSSESSDSNSSVESSTSSLHSQSSSPHPESVSPTNAQDPCSSKELGQRSVAQWQLNKWWRKARKKSSSGEQDPSENIPGYPPSPYAQRAPSPARSWDSNQEYSSCQSPISIPHFNYRLTSSPPVPSPGYPSPVPNTSSSSSPRLSPVPSPVLSVCPSPCGSPRARQLSPLPRDPPRSPSPTLPSAHHQEHPGIHSHLQPATQVKKSRIWSDHLSNTENTENKNRNKTSTEQLHKSKQKSRHTEEQNHSRSKTDTISSHNHKTKPNHFPSSKPVSDISKSKQTTVHCSKSSHKPSFQHNSHINSGCETNNKTHHSSHSQPTTNKNLNSKPRPTSTATFVQDLKRSVRKPESKEQYNEHVDIEGREHERKKHSTEDNQQGKREKRESRRLAEEQLRRPWIQSSEDDYEEEAPAEQRRSRKEREHRKRDQLQKHEWHKAQVNPKPPTSHHRLQEQKDKTKKGRTTISPRGSPTPPSPSPSSTWSSSADSEYQAPITKVPADSTSQKTVHGRSRDPSRPDVNRSKSAPVRIGIPCEKQQSECRQKLYTLVPFGRSEKSAGSSQRGLGNLVVQIDLCLLKRVPDSTTPPTVKKIPSQVSSATKDKHSGAMRHLYVPDGKRKRKMENGVSHRQSKRGISCANESSGPAADNHILTETTHSRPIDEYLDSKRPLSPVSPLADSPVFIKPPFQIKTPEKNRDKKRDVAVKPKMEVESLKCSQSTKPSTESWGPSGHRGAVTLPETQHHAEYYLHEAKRMKHRADAMVDKLGKAVNYVDAALSFMECGKAMEQGPLEAKSPYTMYAETVELIRYAMRLKSHSGPGARQEDKQLAVLCFRCLALLYWQMFRLKKDHALKYSKVLLDYFKTSPKVPVSAPCWNGSAKSPGGHTSSLSPNAKNRSWSSHGANTSSSFINIPHRIHQMAANHLNITNSVLYSYEYWEVADSLAKENIEFFNYLNTLSGPLTLHSSIAHAVQYTRQALQWIRISAKLN